MRGHFDLPHQGEAASKIKVMRGGGVTTRSEGSGEERSRGCGEEEGGREVKIAATVFALLPDDFPTSAKRRDLRRTGTQYLRPPHGCSESAARARRRGVLTNRESSFYVKNNIWDVLGIVAG